MDISYSGKFIKQYRKLSNEVKKLFEEREEVFKIDNFDPKLKTHKLSGKFEGYLSFSINFKYRIVFEYTDEKKNIRFHTIGTHDIYE